MRSWLVEIEDDGAVVLVVNYQVRGQPAQLRLRLDPKEAINLAVDLSGKANEVLGGGF
jgi:hypothetical protein